MRRDLVLPVGACAVCLAALLAAVAHVPLLTIPLGALAVLVAPGMVLQQAFLPGKTIGTAERVALTLGLSLVLTVLGALLLNLTGPGLTPVTWGLFLSTVTATATVVVARRGSPADRVKLVSRVAPSTLLAPLRGRPLRRVVPLVAATVALVFGAIVISQAGARQLADRSTFTQLWLMPQMGRPTQGLLGVHSEEGHVVRYNLAILVDGRPIQRYRIELRSGQTWQRDIDLSPYRGSSVTAQLFRLDSPKRPYRQVGLAGVAR
jgi:hypothetical protein